MRRMAAIALGLSLAACDGAAPPGEGNQAATPEAQAVKAEPPKLSCPFRELQGWKGSIEGGRLLVTGSVDVQMAGMKPQLVERPGGPPVARFDLSLESAPGEPVSGTVRLERRGAPAYRRGEVYCGGKLLTSFDMVLVG